MDDAVLAAALQAAAKALRASDRTEAEVRALLARSGYSEEVQDAAVAWLTRQGYLGDERVVQRESERVGTDPFAGRRRLEARLAARGIDESVAESAAAALSAEDELRKARALLERRRPKLTDPIRAARHLASRGFDEETVRQVVEEAFPDEL